MNTFSERELQLDIVPRSGPIAIHVVYDIRDEDLTEFLDLPGVYRMIERQVIPPAGDVFHQTSIEPH